MMYLSDYYFIFGEIEEEVIKLLEEDNVKHLEKLEKKYDKYTGGLDSFKDRSRKIPPLVKRHFYKLRKDMQNAENKDTIIRKEENKKHLLSRLMTINRTENKYSESSYIIRVYTKLTDDGHEVYKVWRHSHLPEKPREEHVMLDGVKSKRYFYTSNGYTEAPGHFGIAEEDINCLCYLELEIKD